MNKIYFLLPRTACAYNLVHTLCYENQFGACESLSDKQIHNHSILSGSYVTCVMGSKYSTDIKFMSKFFEGSLVVTKQNYGVSKALWSKNESKQRLNREKSSSLDAMHMEKQKHHGQI